MAIIICFISLFKKDKYSKITYEEYKKELLTKINKDKFNFNQIIIFLKNEKCKLNSEKTQNNKIPKFISGISTLISGLSLSMNTNTYEVIFKSVNQIQSSAVDPVKINLAEYLLLIFFILSIILLHNVSNYSFQLEVIDDLIKEYEDKLKEEKDIIKDYIQREYDFSKIKTVEIMNQLTFYDDIYLEFCNYLKTKEFSIKNKEAIKEKNIDDNKEYTAKDLCENLKLSPVDAYVYLCNLRQKNNCEQNEN